MVTVPAHDSRRHSHMRYPGRDFPLARFAGDVAQADEITLLVLAHNNGGAQ